MSLISNDFRVEVIREPWKDSVKVYLLQSFPTGTVAYSMEGGVLVGRSLEEGVSEISPLLAINGFMWEQVVRALTSSLPNIQKDTVDAELKATKYHLEDMRKMVLGRKATK